MVMHPQHLPMELPLSSHTLATSSQQPPTALQRNSPQISFKKEKVIVFGETKFAC